jgi:outer membrane protein TolC
MPDRHEPRDQFVDRLGHQIGNEVRRRNRLAENARWRWWLLQSPLQAAAALAVIVIVSMGLGGIVVAAAYQAQANEQRAILIANYEQRAELARRRLAIEKEQLQVVEHRVSVGIEAPEAVLESRTKVAQAAAQVELVELQMAEVRSTGREPGNAVTSPLVSGRDFVSDRWRVEMSVSVSALELEKARLQAAERRVAVGVGNPIDVESSKTRIVELQAGLRGFEKKLDIRQRFLKREMDAPLADLRVLEAETELRRETLAPRIQLARKTAKDLAQRVETGTAQRVELLESELRLAELSAEMARADMELAMIKRQIDQRRAGR